MPHSKTEKNLRFAVNATDTVLFTIHEGQLKVLLVPIVSLPQYKGYWGLPGGLIHPEETAEHSAKRHLRDKGGVRFTYMEQLYTFSKVRRDPRGRVVSTAYLAVIRPTNMNPKRASNAEWFFVRKLLKLAYDHKEIIIYAKERLKTKLEYTNIAFALLPREFTLGELQQVYEIILGKKFDKRNFQKKIFSLGLLVSLPKRKSGLQHRPPGLYKFRNNKIQVMEII